MGSRWGSGVAILASPCSQWRQKHLTIFCNLKGKSLLPPPRVYLFSLHSTTSRKSYHQGWTAWLYLWLRQCPHWGSFQFQQAQHFNIPSVWVHIVLLLHNLPLVCLWEIRSYLSFTAPGLQTKTWTRQTNSTYVHVHIHHAVVKLYYCHIIRFYRGRSTANGKIT